MIGPEPTPEAVPADGAEPAAASSAGTSAGTAPGVGPGRADCCKARSNPAAWDEATASSATVVVVNGAMLRPTTTGSTTDCSLASPSAPLSRNHGAPTTAGSGVPPCTSGSRAGSGVLAAAGAGV